NTLSFNDQLPPEISTLSLQTLFRSVELKMVPNNSMDPLFAATVQATEEAIVNAMVAAQDMTGVDGHHVNALPHEKLRAVLARYRSEEHTSELQSHLNLVCRHLLEKK